MHCIKNKKFINNKYFLIKSIFFFQSNLHFCLLHYNPQQKTKLTIWLPKFNLKSKENNELYLLLRIYFLIKSLLFSLLLAKFFLYSV